MPSCTCRTPPHFLLLNFWAYIRCLRGLHPHSVLLDFKDYLDCLYAVLLQCAAFECMSLSPLLRLNPACDACKRVEAVCNTMINCSIEA